MQDLPSGSSCGRCPGPVIRDLIVDMTSFFNQYHSVRPYLINDTPPPERERLQSPEERDQLDGLYALLCACCSTACPSYGGIRTSLLDRPACFRLTGSLSNSAIWPPVSDWIISKIHTDTFVAAQLWTAGHLPETPKPPTCNRSSVNADPPRGVMSAQMPKPGR